MMIRLPVQKIAATLAAGLLLTSVAGCKPGAKPPSAPPDSPAASVAAPSSAERLEQSLRAAALSRHPEGRLRALVDGMLAARPDVLQGHYDGRYWEGLLAAAAPLTISRVVGETKTGGSWATSTADGALILITSGEHQNALLIDARSGALRTTMTGGRSAFGIAPDGSRVWAFKDKSLLSWDARTGQPQPPVPSMSIEAAALSMDGKRIALTTSDAHVEVWDTQPSRRVGAFNGCDDERARLTRFAISADGKQVAVGCGSSALALFDASSGKRRVLSAEDADHSLRNLAALSFAPDGKALLAGTQDGTAIVYALPADQAVLRIPGSAALRTVAFSRDGKQFCTAGDDAIVRIFSRESGQLVQTLEGHGGPINSVQFLPADRGLLTASEDETVRIWELHRGRAAQPPEEHTGEVAGALFFDQGRKVATWGSEHQPRQWASDETLRTWDAVSGRSLTRGVLVSMEMSDKGEVGEVVAAAPDGSTLLIKRAFGGLYIKDGVTLETRDILDYDRLGDHYDKFVTPDVRALFIFNTDNRQVWLFDARSGKQQRSYTLPEGITIQALSPDGKRVLIGKPPAGMFDSGGALHDAATGRLVLTLKDAESELAAGAFSPDGRRVTAIDQTGAGGIWDTRTGARLGSLKWEHGAVAQMQFSSNGARILIIAQEHQAQLFDAGTGRALFAEPLASLRHIDLSPDGSRLATVKSEVLEIVLWDTATGKPVGTLKGHSKPISSVAFSPDGKRLVSASADATAIIWNVGDGQRLVKLGGGAGQDEPLLSDEKSRLFLRRLAVPTQIKQVAFSPNGAQILTATEDEAVIWDAATYRLRHWFRNPESDGLHAAQFSVDGARLLMATSYESPHESQGADVYQWSLRSGESLEKLELATTTIDHAALSSADKILATLIHGSMDRVDIQLRDASSGKVLRSLDLPEPQESLSQTRTVHLSPDGKRILLVAKSTLEIWDTTTAKRLIAFPEGETEYVHAAFFPDGKRVASAGRDGVARLHDAQTGAVQRRLSGHTSALTAIRISADGKRVITAGRDQTVRVFASDTGQPLLGLELPAIPTAVDISSDGTKLLIAAEAAYVYSAQHSDLYAFGCRVLRSLRGLKDVSADRIKEALSPCPAP